MDGKGIPSKGKEIFFVPEHALDLKIYTMLGDCRKTYHVWEEAAGPRILS